MNTPINENDLCFLPAVAQRELLRQKQISARELLAACLARIEAVNPAVNAIVTMDADDAMRQAEAADDRFARGETVGPLHGLVIAHKDLLATKGMRTTQGSLLHQDDVPTEDAAIASRMREAGAIRLGKTNVPEMGAGSHTFNPVFGPTRNPYDLGRTVGGSSGGAGAALASGMVSLADGSDLGGSLRNPASFNNVVGLRSAIGRVTRAPVTTGWTSMSVLGAMGRTVADTALLQSVLAGFDPNDPNSLPGDGSEFAAIVDGAPADNLRGVRVGWSRNLDTIPVESVVTDVLERDGRPVLEALGAELRDMEPNLDLAEESFRPLRAWEMAQKYGGQYRQDPGQLSENVRVNTGWGMDLTASDVHAALTARTALYRQFLALFDEIDVLALPTVQLPPFPVDWHYPHAVAGETQADYLGWMRSCWYISATGFPAISIPCGFTADGLPVGIQFVGRPLGESALLRFALAFEAANPAWQRHPDVSS
ncbi:MAG: amidase family protein [Chloroflexota bacterium]|nr:amidase family protein [Chloroflexota bacterium]